MIVETSRPRGVVLVLAAVVGCLVLGSCGSPGGEGSKEHASAAPSARQGKPGEVVRLPTATGVSVTEPAQPALLIGPDAAVAATGLGSGNVLGSGTAATKAASGEEFVYARFDPHPSYPTAVKATREGITTGNANGRTATPSDTPTPTDSTSANAVTWTLVTDAGRHPLTAAPADGEVIGVSVRKGGTATLELDDRGRTQSLDLRTGKRSGDAGFDPVYRSGNVQPIGEKYHGSVTDEAKYGTVRLSVQVHKAALLPYVTGAGYAPKGKTWLVVDRTESNDYLLATFSPRTYTLTVDGKPRRPRVVNGISEGYLITAVPPGLTHATFTVQGTGKAGPSPINQNTPFTMKQKLTVPLSFPAS